VYIHIYVCIYIHTHTHTHTHTHIYYRAGGVAQAVAYLPGKNKVLSSKPQYCQKNNKIHCKVTVIKIVWYWHGKKTDQWKEIKGQNHLKVVFNIWLLITFQYGKEKNGKKLSFFTHMCYKFQMDQINVKCETKKV
jgi:hypothetical protein